MNSLIDLSSFGEAASKLIDKISLGIGWTTENNDMHIAKRVFIQGVQEKDMSPLDKAALISNSKRIIKEYSNQKNIIAIALANLNKDSSPEKIEDDWLLRFMDKARMVSSEDFQLIWGKVLASECNKPGSVPSTLLYILERMDREDAEMFHNLCNVSVKINNDVNPIIDGNRLDEYNPFGISYNSLSNLNSLGLVQLALNEMFSRYEILVETKDVNVRYFDNSQDFVVDKDHFPVGNVLFTKSGEALCNALEPDKVDGFWENLCLPYLTYMINNKRPHIIRK